MAESWNKRDRQQKKAKKKQDKADKMKERKESGSGKSFDDMIAYIDENGNITDTPPDLSKRKEIKLEDIVIGVPEAVELTEEEMRRTGRVTFFNTEKGFGFIKDTQTQESIFVHANNLEFEIKENYMVSFLTEKGPRGPVAVSVKMIK
jgi:cold shock CspA family protein